MPRPPEPTSFQAHFDWLVVWDPGDPPLEDSEGTCLHLYIDPIVLAADGPGSDVTPGDAARIGSAAWQAAQVAANREDPTMEWADILRAYDRATAAYQEAPAILNQVRRLQRALLVLVRKSGLPLGAPSQPGLGVETWALMASNGERGGREQLAPLLQLSESLFARLTERFPGALGAYEDEQEWRGAALPGLVRSLSSEAAAETDPLTHLAVSSLRQCAEVAAANGWVLNGAGPEPEAEWDLGDLLGDAG